MNLSVAREIPSLAHLEIERYCRIVDEWTSQFAHWLLGAESRFRRTPHKWKNDIWFFRVGMLAGYLGHIIGIRYIPEQKYARQVYYTDPSQLFLNGVIDTLQGTCGNMSVLHVAIARRMSWPVTLASAGSHLFSRFDNGKVHHNIEATQVHPGSFSSEEDDFYIKKYNIPRRAIACGSELCRLTAREMMGMFLSLRGRHYADMGNMPGADMSYGLARILLPNHRKTYIGAMFPMIKHGRHLFDVDEIGHPKALAEDLAAQYLGRPLPKPLIAEIADWPCEPFPISPLVTTTGVVELTRHGHRPRKS